MEIKTYKKLIKKPILWIGSITMVSIVIFLITLLTVPITPNTAVVIGCSGSLGIILSYLIIALLSYSKHGSRACFEITTYSSDTEDNEKVTLFTVSKYSHILIWLFNILVFFLQITSYSQAKGVAWDVAANNTIIWFIPLFAVSMFIMYVFIYMSAYVISQDKDYMSQIQQHIEDFKQHN